MSTNEEVLQKLPNDAVRSKLLDIIHNNIPTKKYTIQIEQGSSKGDNYIGVVHKLTVSYDDKGKSKQLNIFVKVPPQNLQRREQFFARPCFLREALMYDEFLTLVGEFQRSKGIDPETDGFREHAKCYTTITDDLHEAIFMEDLSAKGFGMYDRFSEPTLDIVKLIMRALGKYHAFSFALKDQCPEKFDKFKHIVEIFNRCDKFFVDYINDLGNLVTDALTQEGDEKYLEIVKPFWEKNPLFNLLNKLTVGADAEPYAVVCHGDCWSNNILFKFEGETAVDARLIDWQVARYASPVCDLAYYIFSCTSKTFRDKHYREILDVYFEELTQFLKRLGSNPSVLFPRSAFDEQIKKYAIFGLVMGLLVIPTITTKSEDVPDLDDLSEKMAAQDVESTRQAFENKRPESRKRIRDLVIDMIQLKYL